MLGLWLGAMALMLGAIVVWNWLFRKVAEIDSTRSSKRASSPEMKASLAAARKSLPEFWSRMDSPHAGDTEFWVMVEVGDSWVWLQNLSADGATVSGSPVSGPDDLDERLTVSVNEVLDWRYKSGGKVVGDWLSR